MIKPIELEELTSVAPVPAPVAADTIAQLTDPVKRRLVWFLQWASLQDGGLKKFTHVLLTTEQRRLGSATMHRAGFTAQTEFRGPDFESICEELNYYPHDSLQNLKERLEYGDGMTLFDLLPEPDAVAIAREEQRKIDWEKTRRAINEEMQPSKRRLSAATFLYRCRELAVRELSSVLVGLCKDPAASWSVSYFNDLLGALVAALKRQTEAADEMAAQTKIAQFVESALSFAHRTKKLVIVNGTERLGKTEAARKWTCGNPDKARLVSLTAGTTDALFYGEIFDALGCVSKGDGSGGELRRAIRDAVRNTDLTLVFDEAHCLFGLSERASIKRLEYIRTEFVNRGIPVALIITPQFSARLSELEQKTSFNVNQFRGRIAHWAELPKKPSRADIECLCRFYLPSAPKGVHELLVTFALENAYPFAAVNHAIVEAREQLGAGKGDQINEELIKNALRSALFTSHQVASTLPEPAHRPRRGKRPQTATPGDPASAPAPAEHEACTAVASRGQEPGIAAPMRDFSNLMSRAQPALIH